MASFSRCICNTAELFRRGLTWLHNGLQMVVNGISIVIGAVVLIKAGLLIF